jgi:hypothetical protein
MIKHIMLWSGLLTDLVRMLNTLTLNKQVKYA